MKYKEKYLEVRAIHNSRIKYMWEKRNAIKGIVMRLEDAIVDRKDEISPELSKSLLEMLEGIWKPLYDMFDPNAKIKKYEADKD